MVPAEILDRFTDPDMPGHASGSGPGDWFVAEIAAARAAAGDVWVDHHTALTYAAYWGCVRVISTAVASFAWHVYERQGAGRERRPIEDDVSWLLGMQASPEMDAFNFRQVLLKDALTWGNGFAEIERDRAGRPLWLWRIGPERVSLIRDEDTGQLWYEVTNPGGSLAYLPPEDVYHLKGLGPDGLVGYSVVGMHRRTLQTALATDSYGNSYFSRGPMPGGILELPGHTKAEQREEMKQSFQSAYGGSKNAGRVVVLWGGTKFTPLGLPNEDAQFIESKVYSATEICAIFGVPPHKIGRLERATFGNIEEENISFIQECLLSWCRRLEMEADVKLFGRTARGRRFTQLDLGTLLRGNSSTHTQVMTAQVASGLRTINEARAELQLNPHTDGDTLLIQGAMAPVERILQPPEPPPPPSPPPAAAPPPAEGDDEPPAEDEEMPEALARTFGVLLTDTYARQLRGEASRAALAAKAGRLAAWADSNYGDGGPASPARVAELVGPVVAALLAAAGKSGDAGALALDLARSHVGASRAAVASGGVGANGRAKEQAEAHLGILWRAIRGNTDSPRGR